MSNLRGYSRSDKPLLFEGGPAFSDFRLRKFLADIQSRVPAISELRGNWIYVAQVSHEFSDTYRQTLAQLIDAEPVTSSELFAGQAAVVMPRLGTLSPWSSKAVEIIHRCGLDAVSRIEKGIAWTVNATESLEASQTHAVHAQLYDRMTESVLTDANAVQQIFAEPPRTQTTEFDLRKNGRERLIKVNLEMGLALSESEIDCLLNWYRSEKRNPTDAELVMFSQVNSEHCRHKIFNASWSIDGQLQRESMFSMIRATHRDYPDGTLVAYEDNAAVIEGRQSARLFPSPLDRVYRFAMEPAHIVYKAETHNHPTAISPHPGAATGAGGEIRDEGATGIGGKPKAGLCGYSVSALYIPDYPQRWETQQRKPQRIASPLEIMLEAPIGATSFNNEFGRPNIGGYFRTFETASPGADQWYGYHKPIMFAGGLGNIRPMHLQKSALEPGDHLLVIGGPAMLIGLGGGAASSIDQGCSEEELDFASVQRASAEMQRRCQEVIDRCCELGAETPILSIHDVGAGGLSNAVPEIVHASKRGACIDLSAVDCADPTLSPMQIWCNEAQERYVVAVSDANLGRFTAICERERCPCSMIGTVASGSRLKVIDSQSKTNSGAHPVDIDLEFLMAGFLRPQKHDVRIAAQSKPIAPLPWTFAECVDQVLCFPSVADKTFLITIGDRTVTGLIHRDQMVGPWQVPVADAAVTLSSFRTVCGESMAVGERAPIAVCDAAASARMAIGEALTNIRAVPVARMSDVKLCANWMAATSEPGMSAQLYAAVETASVDLCRQLQLAIPVGKDSMSMSTQWKDSSGHNCKVLSPVSLIVTAFSPINDVRKSLTPQLQRQADTKLLLIDLGNGKNRMGMSALRQCSNQVGDAVPDLHNLSEFSRFFEAVGELLHEELLLAYHDRSDGGLFAVLAEMAFAGRCGLSIQLPAGVRLIEFFFNEELGAVIQVGSDQIDRVIEVLQSFEIGHLVTALGSVELSNRVQISVGGERIYDQLRSELHRKWSELTWKMQSLRDNPDCARQEYDRILDECDPGLRHIFEVSPGCAALTRRHKPKVAILREQGVNGHMEMAAAFDRAGFDAVDLVMSDLGSAGSELNLYEGVVMCGGFSFGDVLGAGKGWASTIVYQDRLRDLFAKFFDNRSKFVLGVCNGCQVLAALRDIISGAAHWPAFRRNASEQFEARLVMVELTPSNSIFTNDCHGSYLPVAVAHGEGRAAFAADDHAQELLGSEQIVLRYTDNRLQVSNTYPYNPNGSQHGVAAVSNDDGRITAMMPHPERVFRSLQYSWAPSTEHDDSPWMQMFYNARRWVGD